MMAAWVEITYQRISDNGLVSDVVGNGHINMLNGLNLVHLSADNKQIQQFYHAVTKDFKPKQTPIENFRVENVSVYGLSWLSLLQVVHYPNNEFEVRYIENSLKRGCFSKLVINIWYSRPRPWFDATSMKSNFG